jgi:hypothetical protein
VRAAASRLRTSLGVKLQPTRRGPLQLMPITSPSRAASGSTRADAGDQPVDLSPPRRHERAHRDVPQTPRARRRHRADLDQAAQRGDDGTGEDVFRDRGYGFRSHRPPTDHERAPSVVVEPFVTATPRTRKPSRQRFPWGVRACETASVAEVNRAEQGGPSGPVGSGRR